MTGSKKSKILRGIVFAGLCISAILYSLADRYLIEHVEIVQAIAPEATAIEVAALHEQEDMGAAPDSRFTQTATVPPASIKVNNWNYQSARVSISIKKISNDSAGDTVTYFVADIILEDMTDLRSAFARNQFGTNIIEYTSEIAADNHAIFAINGDYYGFRSDGIIIRNGVIYCDEAARMGLALYRDGHLEIYDESETNAQALLDAGVWQTLSFGPALIENGVTTGKFEKVNIDTNFGNHSIQGNNPRTGVGIIDSNHLVFVVVDGRSEGYSHGLSLEEFAAIFKQLGCTDAYNLDGGGSSTMYFDGRVVNNPLGRNKERGTSDILFLMDER